MGLIKEKSIFAWFDIYYDKLIFILYLLKKSSYYMFVNFNKN